MGRIVTHGPMQHSRKLPGTGKHAQGSINSRPFRPVAINEDINFGQQDHQRRLWHRQWDSNKYCGVKKRLHMEMNSVPTKIKTPTCKSIEAMRIYWYWDNAYKCCKTIWSIKRIGKPQVPHTTHSSCYSQLRKRYWHIQNISICFKLSTARNLPSKGFIKDQWPNHSSMSASTQMLMSLSPLEWLTNKKHSWNMWQKRHINYFFTHA